MNALCQELAETLRQIQSWNKRLGEMNMEADAIHSRLHELEAQRQRIEIDLTTVKLGVL